MAPHRSSPSPSRSRRTSRQAAAVPPATDTTSDVSSASAHTDRDSSPEVPNRRGVSTVTQATPSRTGGASASRGRSSSVRSPIELKKKVVFNDVSDDEEAPGTSSGRSRTRSPSKPRSNSRPRSKTPARKRQASPRHASPAKQKAPHRARRAAGKPRSSRSARRDRPDKSPGNTPHANRSSRRMCP